MNEINTNPTAELITALLKCQKEITHVVQKETNDFFSSKYATYEQLRDHVEPIYSKENVYIHQVSHQTEKGIGVETIFIGHGGQLSNGITEIPATKTDPHKYGSSLTYSRRYSLALATGIGGAKDDDGNLDSTNPKLQIADNAKAQIKQMQEKDKNSMKKAIDFEIKEREAKQKKSQSIKKYVVKKGSEEICKLASNQFASYCQQYIKDPAKETDREIFVGTEAELILCLNDETLREDCKTKIQNILAQFGGKNADQSKQA
tara:strand:- start:169 stop:951 length:783 start_codon:yes stop_codon:yes gene_type:complete